MYYGDRELSARSSQPDLAELLRRFPGSVMVADEEMGFGAAPVWHPVCYGRSRASEVMRSIQGQYHENWRHLLWVTTARSAHRLDPRGLPQEDATSQILNFLLRTDERYRYRPGRNGSDSPGSGRGEAMVREMRAIHAEVDEAVVDEVVVRRDGIESVGRRIVVRGCAVVELAGDQGGAVFCTGTPEIVERLVLRTALPEDFPPKFRPKLGTTA